MKWKIKKIESKKDYTSFHIVGLEWLGTLLLHKRNFHYELSFLFNSKILYHVFYIKNINKDDYVFHTTKAAVGWILQALHEENIQYTFIRNILEKK